MYLYGLNPRVADEDCDGSLDGDDENPYASNVPPGQSLSPEQRAACVGAASGSSSASALALSVQDVSRHVAAPMAASQPWTQDVGLIVFEDDGTVSVLARPPVSENRVVAIEVLVSLEGKARTTGGIVSTSGLIRAELQPLEEQDADNTAVQYTHGIRVALPEGMVEATIANYALTIMDENLNAAVYSGSASGFSMAEVEYAEDRNAADASATNDANSWDYVRTAVTGGADAEGSSSASTSSDPVFGLGLGRPSSSDSKAYRIVTPVAPALVGKMVDGVLRIEEFSGGLAQRFVFYNDTAVEVEDDEYSVYLPAACCGGFWKGVKRVAQGTTKAMSTGFDFASDVGTVLNGAGQEVKTFTVGFYNDVKNPRTPEMFAARLVLDIVGIGDVIDIVEGAANGDWLMLGLGVAGLALSVATVVTFGAAAPLDNAVTAAKIGLRASRAAGLSDEAAQVAGKYIGRAAKNGADAADNARDVARFSDTVNNVAKQADSRTMRGLEVLLKADEAGELAARGVKENRALLRMFGDYAQTHGDEAATELLQALKNSDNVDLDSAVRLWVKYDKHPQFRVDGVDLMEDLKLLADEDIPGLNGLISAAAKQAPKQGKGHYFTIAEVAKAVRNGENVQELGKLQSVTVKLPWEEVAESKSFFPDAAFDQAGARLFREYKNYAGQLPPSKFIQAQFYKYGQHLKNAPEDIVEVVVQNGNVHPRLKELAVEQGIKLVDRFGNAIV